MNTVYFEKNSRWVFLRYYWIRQKVNHLGADTPFRVILEIVLWRRKHWLSVVHVLLQDVRSCLFNAYNFFYISCCKIHRLEPHRMNEFWINSNNIKLWAIFFLRIYNFKYWKQMNFKIYKIGFWHLFKIMPILPDTTPIACKICHLLDSLKNPLPSIFLSIEHLRTPPTTEVSSTIKWSEAHCKEKRKKKKYSYYVW